MSLPRQHCGHVNDLLDYIPKIVPPLTIHMQDMCFSFIYSSYGHMVSYLAFIQRNTITITRASLKGGGGQRGGSRPPFTKSRPPLAKSHPLLTNLTPLETPTIQMTASDIIYCALKLLNASPPPPPNIFENLFSPPLGKFSR